MSAGLRDIRISGFASLATVRLQPGRLTMLIGPNGSSKSNILRAPRMVPPLCAPARFSVSWARRAVLLRSSTAGRSAPRRSP